jgi:hypothetical protein
MVDAKRTMWNKAQEMCFVFTLFLLSPPPPPHSREISAQQLSLKKVGVAENEKKGSNNLACIVIITVPTAGYNIKLDYSVQE